MHENTDIINLENEFLGTGAAIGLIGSIGGAVNSIFQNKKNRQLAEKQAEADRLAMLQLEAKRIELKEKNQKLFLFAAVTIVVIIFAIYLINKFSK